MIESAIAGWNQLLAGKVLWRLAPELQSALADWGRPTLEEWLDQGRAAVVKHGPRRTTYRLELESGHAFYVKRHRLNLRGRLRQAFRPSKAHVELARALELARRGVPTVVPLALGEQHIPLGVGESILVTRGIEDTQTLNRFIAVTLAEMPAPRQVLLRQRLAMALGKLLARMHDAGACHGDLHAANILIELTADDWPLLYLIDLDAVRLGPPLDWPASRSYLALLARWFVPRSSWVDRMRFWRAYYEGRGLGVWPRGCQGHREHFAMARQIEEQTHATTLAFWKKRDRRCLANNRYFRKIHNGDVRGHAVADLDLGVWANLLHDPDAPFQMPNVRLLKNSRSSTVAELEDSLNGVTRRWIYKRFRVTAWTDSWAALMRPTPALRSWQSGHALWERCLPTARPLLVLQRLRAGLPREAYLLTEKIENAVDLHEFLGRLGRLAPLCARRRLREVIDHAARAIRRLHGCCLSNRDLKAVNMLVSLATLTTVQPLPPFSEFSSPTPGVSLPSYLPMPAWGIWFIDLVGVRRYKRLSRGRRVQNLARLNASFCKSGDLTRTDKLRFLRGYLLWNLVGRGDWKSWWRAVDEATTRKISRNLRLGRVLA